MWADPESTPGPVRNALWASWLELAAKELQTRNNKSHNVYRKAAESLRACPLPFTHPRETMQLRFVGESIVKRLEQRWLDYCTEKDLSSPSLAAEPAEIAAVPAASTDAPETRRRRGVYHPAYRSGGYAIMLALHLLGDEESSRGRIEERARPYCDASFDSSSGNHYTAWSSIKTLLNRELVVKHGTPAKYSLTTEGREVARKLIETHNLIAADKIPLDDVGPAQADCGADHHDTPDGIAESMTETNLVPEFLAPGEYDIHLVIDTREVKSTQDRDFFRVQLEARGVPASVRALELGDTLWVARCRKTGIEYVLDYIVERKRLDDLVSSIKDGRLSEQKFRLHKSGVKHVIYLIEDKAIDGAFSDAVSSALASAQVIDKVFVQRVDGVGETVDYLARLTRKIIESYRGVPIYIIPDRMVNSRTHVQLRQRLREQHGHDFFMCFDTFMEAFSKSKQQTVADMSFRMLMTIRGLSAQKAIQVHRQYPTICHLMEAFENSNRPAEMIADACDGTLRARNKIGKSLSAKIYEVFN